MGSERGPLAAGQGGCNLSGLGLSSQAWAENNGEPGPLTPRARCWGSFLFPQACSLCVCIGGSGEFCLLWFPFFFLVCPLDSPPGWGWRV